MAIIVRRLDIPTLKLSVGWASTSSTQVKEFESICFPGRRPGRDSESSPRPASGTGRGKPVLFCQHTDALYWGERERERERERREKRERGTAREGGREKEREGEMLLSNAYDFSNQTRKHVPKPVPIL